MHSETLISFRPNTSATLSDSVESQQIHPLIAEALAAEEPDTVPWVKG